MDDMFCAVLGSQVELKTIVLKVPIHCHGCEEELLKKVNRMEGIEREREITDIEKSEREVERWVLT